MLFFFFRKKKTIFSTVRKANKNFQIIFDKPILIIRCFFISSFQRWKPHMKLTWWRHYFWIALGNTMVASTFLTTAITISSFCLIWCVFFRVSHYHTLQSEQWMERRREKHFKCVYTIKQEKKRCIVFVFSDFCRSFTVSEFLSENFVHFVTVKATE